MKGKVLTKRMYTDEHGQESFRETLSECNFDQGEVFSWTVLKDEDNIPYVIAVISKQGISMDIDYDENVLSNLAAEFRSRGVL